MRSGRRCNRRPARARRRNNGESRCTISPSIVRPRSARRPGLLARNPDGKLLAGGHSLIPVMKQRLAQPVGADRSVAGRGPDRRRAEGPLGRDRRHDAACRRRQFAGAAAGDARARRGAGLDRRSAGAQPRHHRRLDRQQRSERRLSGGLPRAGRHHHHQQAAHRGRRFLHRHVLDRAGRRTRSSPRCSSRSPSKAAYEKFKHPASGFALVGVFVSQARLGHPRGGDRRRLERRVPREIVRGGAEEALRGEVARGHDAFRRMA